MNCIPSDGGERMRDVSERSAVGQQEQFRLLMRLPEAELQRYQSHWRTARCSGAGAGIGGASLRTCARHPKGVSPRPWKQPCRTWESSALRGILVPTPICAPASRDPGGTQVETPSCRVSRGHYYLPLPCAHKSSPASGSKSLNGNLCSSGIVSITDE